MEGGLMAQHILTAHYGEPHVSAHEAAIVQGHLYGTGRYKLQGMELTTPNPFLLHVETGIALIDGRWYLITGGGENIDIPAGSLGMQRRDRVFLEYHRGTDGVEDLRLKYVVGTPTTGVASAPLNEHPASLYDQPTTAWIPFCDIPISGYTVGTPTMLLEGRALSLPAQQCEQCSEMMAIIQAQLLECRMATAEAREVIRSVPAALAVYDQRIQAIEDLVDNQIKLMAKQIKQLAAMLANNIAAYVLVGDTLAAPTSWVQYNEEDESTKLAYTSYDESTDTFSIDEPITIDERVEANTANVDYLMMLSGEE